MDKVDDPLEARLERPPVKYRKNTGSRFQKYLKLGRSNSVSADGKLYSFHAPEVACVGRGKASARRWNAAPEKNCEIPPDLVVDEPL